VEASEELKKREEAIASLYTADAGNKLCADCGDLNPTWISINLGILICLECSGIHRSMGTHISKVRSLTLDTLHPETKKYIVALGNRRINEIFGPDVLTAIPNSFGERLNPNSTRKDREAWIKAKYGEKIFVETYRGQNIQNDFVASIRQQDVPRCMLLYAQGANLNFKYESDAARSPLHYSADGSNPLVCMFLLQNGAHVNAKDSNGTTPLHVAAASGHVACAAVLCKWRAKVDSSDIQGKTALDVALETQNADAITLLRLAKLVREGGGLDDKSFSEALDSFSADLQSTPTKTSDHLSANGPSKLRASSPGRKSSSAASSTSTSNASSTASSNATSPAIAVNGVSAAHHHSSTTSAGVGSSLSPPKGSAVLSTSAPSTASSFSFLSKLDRKKS
jgi:Arf-GAP/coiled-coil/ANK repeat/PH domain-containing protein